MSRPKHGRPSRTYVHPDERKFKDVTPQDGEEVLYRFHGHKSYGRGVWSDTEKRILAGESQLEVKWLTGWLPISYYKRRK